MSTENLHFDLPCVIFAGGKSSRMGQDKALLPFGEQKSLAEYQYRRLSKIFSSVYISTKENKFAFSAPLILDGSHDVYAPTPAFVASFQELKEDIFVISVDTPFIDADTIEKIYTYKDKGFDAVIAKTKEGTHPLCGIYSYRLLSRFQDMLKEDSHRLGYLLKNVNTKFVYFDESDAFENLNHPHEYTKALQRAE